ncbi:MAG: type II toxin-antitoxin system antitoxin SocA domain-containing protein [Pyrobaculum sp.]|uniref:Uncharacterized protein n=2 Tax=Pyrobaculum aerophilum TaxID=13773 RepID=Q8ZXV7_PYRAE|nr:type II toxin-antitoxin system antitoxin SocA domain-containing protein [Pyrobaculum aerophilum]AAL63239.1 hypothetical protein PAE1074 [Pyrobaculum aerophilum str. IM2]HII48000.1 SocA family protein [Pyrobaculum aerophilum]
MSYRVEDVVYYVVKRLGEVNGIKKLMKLVFLLQYEARPRLGRRIVVKYLYEGQPVARSEFYIWSFGPMSNEVYDAVEALENEGLLETSLGDYIKIITKGEKAFELPPPVARRVDEVAERYGRCRGWELEKVVNKMLKLDVEKKNEYMGFPVDKYLELEGLKLEMRELAHGRVETKPRRPPSGQY